MLFNVDLIGLTPVLLENLDSWKPFIRLSHDRNFMLSCLERYEKVWLPLLATCNMDIEPPDDVHWLWYLHLLKPCEYAVFCKVHLNCVLPHKFRRTKMETKFMKNKTKMIWNVFYPKESFEMSPEQLLHADNSSNTSSKLEHLFLAAKSEREFIYRCDLPHFRDQTFQLSAVRRYKQYLSIKRECPHWVPCRPPTDIEMVWRVHLLQPSQYISDILRIIDSNSNRTDFATYSLDQSQFFPLRHLFPTLIHDNQFWNFFFPDDTSPFHANGSVNRQAVSCIEGTSRYALKEFSSIGFEADSIDECLMTFDGVSISELESKGRDIKVVAKLLGSNSFQHFVIFQLKEKAAWSFKSSEKRYLKFEKKGLFGECRFVRVDNKGIEVDVFVDGGLFSKYKQVVKKTFDPLFNLSELQASDNCYVATSHGMAKVKQEINLPKVTYTDPKISISYTLEFPNKKLFSFVLDRNHAECSAVPDYLQDYLCNVLSWQNASNDLDEQNHFMVARHSVKCRDHGLAFGVEVVRNERHNLNAVLLFHNNLKLVAVAYTIDAGYLPNQTQVMETCPLSFNAEKGDVSMMIQKATGQDYIVVASFKEGGQKAYKTIVMNTYNTLNKRCDTIEVRADEMQKICNGTTTIDLPSGGIMVRDGIKNVSDHLSWAFSVGCLFLSIQCQRFFDFGSGQELDSVLSGSVGSLSTCVSDAPTDEGSVVVRKRSKSRISLIKMKRNRSQEKRRRMSASFTFLLACGLKIDFADPVASYCSSVSSTRL